MRVGRSSLGANLTPMCALNEEGAPTEGTPLITYLLSVLPPMAVRTVAGGRMVPR